MSNPTSSKGLLLPFTVLPGVPHPGGLSPVCPPQCSLGGLSKPYLGCASRLIQTFQSPPIALAMETPFLSVPVESGRSPLLYPSSGCFVHVGWLSLPPPMCCPLPRGLCACCSLPPQLSTSLLLWISDLCSHSPGVCPVPRPGPSTTVSPSSSPFLAC